MKAEHRKELQTNELAAWLARTIEHIKAGNRTYWAWGAVVVVVVGLLGWWVYDLATRPSSSTAVLLKLQAAGNNVVELEKLADENPRTIPGRTARFELARILYEQGVRDLSSFDLHASAVGKLIKARDIYIQLANDCRDMPVLTEEALMWTARAEEALIGATNPDRPGEPAGTLDKAIEYYQKLADSKPETFETKSAAQRAQALREKKTQIETFYTKLNQQGGPAKASEPASKDKAGDKNKK